MKIKLFLAIGFIAVIGMFGCQTEKETYSHSPFHPAISGFTSGQISAGSPVAVEFTAPVEKASPGQNVEKGIFTLKPSVKGDATWADNRTILFRPAERMPSGHEFKAEIDLPRLMPDEEEPFFFTFRTVPQNAWLSRESMGPVSVSDYDTYTVTARVTLADVADNKVVEQNVEVTLDGDPVSVKWTHLDDRNHLLTLGDIQRAGNPRELEVVVARGVLSPGKKQAMELQVPAKDAFKIMSSHLETTPRNVISVVFSDPLDPGQDMSGLFRLANKDIDWNIDNNLMELYPGEDLTGQQELAILPDIRNISGKKLNTTGKFSFSFSSEAPAVEILGDGTIMPYSDGLYLPFRAVSLKAVKVRVIKIYEHNIGHFLQINRLDGHSQLKRAGRLEHQQRVEIDNDPTLDLDRWNTFSLDLSRFIQPDPGSIYRVELGFEREDAIYPCAGEDEPAGEEEQDDPDEDFWDSTDNYYATGPRVYPANYSWRDRDNPCSSSYYTRERWAARNVLASNLGLMVKSGTTDNLLVTVTDIRTAEPLNGVDVEIFNLQMVPIGRGQTDKNGQVALSTEEKPFLLIAKYNKQRGYLRLDDGQALATDRFDVSGETVREGLKGFIFGERGVWRPGDSLFVSFMPMESVPGTLPPDHPVTFELMDTRGRLIHKQTQSRPGNKLYTFRTKTDEDAPTGFWMARVTMGGVSFEKSLRVETVRPNRLKIELGMADEILNSGTTAHFDIRSSWLHGTPATELKADVRMDVRSGKTTFDGFQGYTFDDPTREVEASEITIYEGILDSEGHASFRERIPEFNRAPGKLRGVFTTRVFEEGGAFSTSSQTAPVSPFDTYTGIRLPEGDDRGLLMTGEDHAIELVTLDASGQPAGGQQLNYTVYKIDWRWWWEKSREDLGRYISSGSRNIINSGTVNTSANGKGSFNFRVNQPDWGRYLVRVENPASGHSTAGVVQVDWPGWARESRGGDGASHLVFKTGKSTYNVGEDVSVTFPSSAGGRAMITIETGSRVLKSWWVEPREKETTFKFEATPEMTPNIYVSVTLIQPREQTVNNRPLRLYGIVPAMIEDPATRLQPTIETRDTWRPGETATIKIGEANKQPMSYVVAVVDEGLLDLTGHRTPDPWSRFNAREALGVKTWDIYDEVIGAFGGKIEQLFSVGGDGELSGADGTRQTRRFEPMVRFIGPFNLEKRDRNHHEIEIPSYTGSVRVMAIASNGEATGSNHTTVKIKKPLMVWSAMPRVMSPEEKLSLPVTVFVTEDNIENVEVSLEGSGHYSVNGSGRQTISFDGPGEKNVWFEIETLQLTGPSRITVKASANGEESVQTTHLKVRVPNPPVTKTVSDVLEGEATGKLAYTLPGVPGTNSARLEVSAIPPMDLTSRLDFLIKYPHGCIEQITSGAFPQLYLDKVVEMDDEQRGKVRDNIIGVLQRLGSYQTSDGGFAYWPGQSQTSDWGSSYAGHFLLEAERQGYAVRPSLKSDWLNSQNRRAKAWLPKPETNAYTPEQMLQAYRLYTLALAGEPSTGAMNRLRQQSGLIVQARWLLASAYALSGMHEVAAKLIDEVSDMSSAQVQPRTYGSSLRDKAILINVLDQLNRRETAMPLVREVAEQLNTGDWYSTQTTAWALMSVVNFAGDNTDTGRLQFTYTLNNQDPVTVSTDKPISRVDMDTESSSTGEIAISNDTKRELFVSLVLNGTPAGIDATELSENLEVETRFLTMDDKSLSPGEIEQGTDFKYLVRVSNPGTAGDAENLALTRMVPSGWEIRNTRLEGLQGHERDVPDYRDIRDDRVLSYFDLASGQSKTFVIVVHAAFRGEFYLPPVTCEAMYNNAIRARVPGSVTRVVGPNDQ